MQFLSPSLVLKLRHAALQVRHSLTGAALAREILFLQLGLCHPVTFCFPVFIGGCVLAAGLSPHRLAVKLTQAARTVVQVHPPTRRRHAISECVTPNLFGPMGPNLHRRLCLDLTHPELHLHRTLLSVCCRTLFSVCCTTLLSVCCRTLLCLPHSILISIITAQPTTCLSVPQDVPTRLRSALLPLLTPLAGRPPAATLQEPQVRVFSRTPWYVIRASVTGRLL